MSDEYDLELRTVATLDNLNVDRAVSLLDQAGQTCNKLSSALEIVGLGKVSKQLKEVQTLIAVATALIISSAK